MLFVFQPIEMVPDQEDLLPAISEDGVRTDMTTGVSHDHGHVTHERGHVAQAGEGLYNAAMNEANTISSMLDMCLNMKFVYLYKLSM